MDYPEMWTIGFIVIYFNITSGKFHHLSNASKFLIEKFSWLKHGKLLNLKALFAFMCLSIGSVNDFSCRHSHSKLGLLSENFEMLSIFGRTASETKIHTFSFKRTYHALHVIPASCSLYIFLPQKKCFQAIVDTGHLALAQNSPKDLWFPRKTGHWS